MNIVTSESVIGNITTITISKPPNTHYGGNWYQEFAKRKSQGGSKPEKQ